MKQDEYKEAIEGEYISILAQKFGITKNAEAVEILRWVVFGGSMEKEGDS